MLLYGASERTVAWEGFVIESFGVMYNMNRSAKRLRKHKIILLYKSIFIKLKINGDKGRHYFETNKLFLIFFNFFFEKLTFCD